MCVWSATKLGWSKVSRWFGAPTYCMCVPDSDSLPLSSATTSPRYSSALHSRKSSPFGVGRHLRRFTLGQHRNPRANREALMLPETSRAPRNPHHPADNFTGNGPLSNAYTAKRGTDHQVSLRSDKTGHKKATPTKESVTRISAAAVRALVSAKVTQNLKCPLKGR